MLLLCRNSQLLNIIMLPEEWMSLKLYRAFYLKEIAWQSKIYIRTLHQDLSITPLMCHMSIINGAHRLIKWHAEKMYTAKSMQRQTLHFNSLL